MDYLKLVTVGLALIIGGCGHHGGQNPYVQPNVKPTTKLHTKQIVALAFISYAGDEIDAPVYMTNQVIKPCVASELERHEILQGDYSLAWGPYVYRFPNVDLDDNMMYAVWNEKDKSKKAVDHRDSRHEFWFGKRLDRRRFLCNQNG